MLPGLSRALAGRSIAVAIAPAGADALPRFDYRRHLAALTADPPAWPERTSAAALLAFDVAIGRERFGLTLPPRRFRLELLDYPGEWLLDLPLLRTSFDDWSAATLRRLEPLPEAAEFLAFATALRAGGPADEALAATGHRLYRTLLTRLRDERRLALLQPGRFLMPAPGPEPGWMPFFPHRGPNRGSGGLHALLAERYTRYVDAVRADLAEPMFGNLDRIVVLADLLTALHAGADAFADTAAALAAAAAALRWEWSWAEALLALGRLQLPPRAISRVAFVATKADHVAERQRGNLAALLRDAARPPEGSAATGYFAAASVRCTEDLVWALEGRPVSAVRGRRIGDERMLRSYPGEVPDRMPGPAFWEHPFLELPEFEPRRPPDSGRGGVPELGLDAVLAFLLEDVL